MENDDFFGGRFIGLGAPVFDEKTGWSFSGGGFLRNFRGRNEQVGFGFSTGGLNMVAFAYSYIRLFVIRMFVYLYIRIFVWWHGALQHARPQNGSADS